MRESFVAILATALLRHLVCVGDRATMQSVDQRLGFFSAQGPSKNISLPRVLRSRNLEAVVAGSVFEDTPGYL